MFDVFGTVVDWRTSIIQECEALGTKKNLNIDWSKFVDEWRAGYRPAIDTIRLDGAKWRILDDLHMEILLKLLDQHSILLSDDEIEYLNKCWHRLNPWKDAVNGLIELNRMFITAFWRCRRFWSWSQFWSRWSRHCNYKGTGSKSSCDCTRSGLSTVPSSHS